MAKNHIPGQGRTPFKIRDTVRAANTSATRAEIANRPSASPSTIRKILNSRRSSITQITRKMLRFGLGLSPMPTSSNAATIQSTGQPGSRYRFPRFKCRAIGRGLNPSEEYPPPPHSYRTPAGCRPPRSPAAWRRCCSRAAFFARSLENLHRSLRDVGPPR